MLVDIKIVNFTINYGHLVNANPSIVNDKTILEFKILSKNSGVSEEVDFCSPRSDL